MLEVVVRHTQNGGGGRLIADQVIRADTPALRRKGLLGRQTLDPDEGALLVNPPRLPLSVFHSIHMFGVPFALAVAWLDEGGTILGVRHARPGRIYFPPGFFVKSRYILEVHPAHLPVLLVGHRVRWREVAHA